MEKEILDLDFLADEKIKNTFSSVILYLCLLIYPLEFLMGYKAITFDYSASLGDTIFSPAYNPLYNLVVLFMVPLGIIISLISYLKLERDRIGNKAIFLLISPSIQLLIYIIIFFRS